MRSVSIRLCFFVSAPRLIVATCRSQRRPAPCLSAVFLLPCRSQLSQVLFCRVRLKFLHTMADMRFDHSTIRLDMLAIFSVRQLDYLVSCLSPKAVARLAAALVVDLVGSLHPRGQSAAVLHSLCTLPWRPSQPCPYLWRSASFPFAQSPCAFRHVSHRSPVHPSPTVHRPASRCSLFSPRSHCCLPSSNAGNVP